MKRCHIILFFSIITSLFFLQANGQVIFRTVVPQRSIAIGESFQVQYILEGAEKISDFESPQFPGFKVVAGPNIYSGKKMIADDKTIYYKNLVFTLVAESEGEFPIYGASCSVNGKIRKSNNVIVKVISPKESDESSYFLKTGEDPIKKIRKNLFLKLTVNKQTCFIGEPLVATFKLYSRLQSRSNIIKNPGFYGFSVYDMIDLEDQIQAEEKLNGEWFDVHTIRKLQLYPLEAGTFTIDPMELANKVEFSRSIINKKNEQEITENMHGDNEDEHNANTEVYEMNIKSDPVTINVKPLPRKNQVDTFAGAVGNFSITVFAEKDSLLKNEEGSLTVDIKGAGNFQRVNAPVIQWPVAIEVFEPSVKDTFNKQQVPLTGQREFRYIFVSNKPGFYTLPPILFSFFDIKTKTYKASSTKPITIFISAKSKKDKLPTVSVAPVKSNKKSNWWLIPSGLAVLVAGILLWTINKRNKISTELPNKIYKLLNQTISIEEILMPPKKALMEKDKIFYEELDRSIWNYFTDRFRSFGIPMIKKDLANTLISKGIESGIVSRLIEIIHQCETGIYTNAEMHINKEEMFENTKQILVNIEDSLK